MQILIDDLPCEVDARTVGEAIEGAAGLARDRGRLIVDVIVDGTRWSEADLASDEQHTKTADVIKFISAEPVELVRHTFADAADALSEAADLQREAAELLQSGEGTVSMDKLGEAVSIWLCVQEAIVSGAQLVELDLDTVEVSGEPLPESIRRLNQHLAALRRGLEERDETALADTLLYEFPPIIEQWRRVFTDLQGRLA